MQKKIIISIVVLLLAVFVLAGSGKNNKTATNLKTNNNAEKITDMPNKAALNEEIGDYESILKTNLPQSNAQNNFIVTLERIVLAKDKTTIIFKIKNDRAVEVKLYFRSAYIVQKDREFKSKGNPRTGFQYRPGNKEINVEVIFPPLPYRNVATLFIGRPSSDFLVDDTDWQNIEFKINLTGEGIIDEEKEVEKRAKLEKETIEGYSEELKQYMNHLHPCHFGVKEIDGHQLYLRPIFLLNGKELSFSIGYIDDFNKWNETAKYTSREVDLIESDNFEYYSYLGGFGPRYSNSDGITISKNLPFSIFFDQEGVIFPTWGGQNKLYVEDTNGPSIASLSE